MRRVLARMMRARREMPYFGPSVVCAIIAFGMLVALIGYMAAPVEPFGFYKDLGFDHEITAWAAHTVRSPVDFIDMLGWAPWNGTPLFYLSSYVCDLISAPLAVLFGDAWLSIKIVQVLQVFVAIGGAFALYSTVRRPTIWALLFGFLYAALPATELAIRGNMELGWITALLPGAFAVGKLALRRYGARATPIVGAMCGFVGGVIAIEYFAFVSAPLFALVVASEWRPLRAQWFYIPLGMLSSMTVGAFFLVPTFVHPLFSDAAVRIHSLVTGEFLSLFSDSWVDLLTLVPQESRASPIPAFDVTESLPTLYAVGALLWFGAIVAVATRRSKKTSTDALSLFVVGSCVVLSLGTTLPFGKALWDTLFLVPHLDAIRTTDRFLEIPTLMILLWFVLALESFSSRFEGRGRSFTGGAYTAIAIALVLIDFDVSQHCFSLDRSKGFKVPQYDAVASIVSRLGGRTASFATVNGGSSDDAPDYGLPQPISAAYLDLGGRFGEDGMGAAGVLGRLGVHSVIVAPAWTYTVNTPSMVNVYRHVAVARTVFESPEDVRVFTIPTRPMVSAAKLYCTYGGPAELDALELQPMERDVAFGEPGEHCERLAYLDFDPYDAWGERAIEAWSGRALVPGSKQVRDYDYPFLLNRILLDVPWYRNAVDGMRPVFDATGAAGIVGPTAIDVPAHADWPAGTSLALRFASHSRGRIEISIGDRTIVSTFDDGVGFNWHSIRLHRRVDRAEPVHITIRTVATREDTDGVILDGVAIFPDSPSWRTRAKPSLIVFSTRRFSNDRRRDAIDTSSGLELAATERLHRDHVGPDVALVADGPRARAVYRWHGPAGTYEIRVAAFIQKPDAIVDISADHAPSVQRLSARTFDPKGPTTTFARVALRPGSEVTVRLSLPHYDQLSADRLERVEAIAVSPIRLESDARARDLDFEDPENGLTAVSHLTDLRAIELASEGATGVSGSSLSFDVSSDRLRGIELRVERTGDGYGAMTLVCGHRSMTAILSAASTSLALSGITPSSCTGKITWLFGTFAISAISLRAAGDSTIPRTGRIWVVAGEYALAEIASNGLPRPADGVRVDGCRRNRCAFETDGFKTITLAANDRDGYLVFRRHGPIDRPNTIAVRQDSALRWTVSLARSGGLELEQLFDGRWRAASRDGVATGERCDISNTCFPALSAGSYRIYHEWSAPLELGIAITIATLIGTTLLLIARRSNAA